MPSSRKRTAALAAATIVVGLGLAGPAAADTSQDHTLAASDTLAEMIASVKANPALSDATKQRP